MKFFIVSNMFPDEKHPSYGIFVKHFCEQLDSLQIAYDTSVMKQADNPIQKLLRYMKFYVGTVVRMLFVSYDAVYVHYASHSSPPVLFANKLRKKKIFVNVHGSDVVPENPKQEKMQKYTQAILKVCETVVVPSVYFQNYTVEKYHLADKCVFVYPSGGIDKNMFYMASPEKKQELRASFGFFEKRPVFAMIGRISAGKGWDVFLKAISICVKKNLCADFLILGKGAESQQLLQLCDILALTEYVKIIDQLVSQEQLANWYNAVDYFVFPTKREGESLGLVAIEAMACGTPVISSDFAAPKYYVQENKNGFQFQVDNAEALSEKIETCIDVFSTSAYDVLCQNAIQTASAFYLENIRQDLQNILEN